MVLDSRAPGNNGIHPQNDELNSGLGFRGLGV